MYKYFTNDDFKGASPSCSISQMSPDLLAKLDRAREVAGIPFVVTSAYRPSSWDIAKGRSGNGAHTRTPGLAVDIRCRNSRERWLIVMAAVAVGFPRIGVAKGFVHLDIDTSLPNPVLWTY